MKQDVESVHRGLYSTLLWMSLLFTFILSGLISLSGSGIVVMIVVVVCLAYMIRGFKMRKPSMFIPAGILWLILTPASFIIALLHLYQGMQGDFLAILLSLLLLYVSFNMFRQGKTFNNPLYKSWYFGEGHVQSLLSLEEGELMAACPHCLSLLAVKPFSLKPEEKCPNCSGRLVSDETISRFEEE